MVLAEHLLAQAHIYIFIYTISRHMTIDRGILPYMMTNLVFVGLAWSWCSTVFCLLVWLGHGLALSFVCWPGLVLVWHCLLFAGHGLALSFVCWSGLVMV